MLYRAAEQQKEGKENGHISTEDKKAIEEAMGDQEGDEYVDAGGDFEPLF